MSPSTGRGQELPRRVSILEHEQEALSKRVTKHGKEIDEILISRARTDTILNKLNETVDALNKTVHRLELAPAHKWDSLILVITSAIASGLIGYLFAHAGLVVR